MINPVVMLLMVVAVVVCCLEGGRIVCDDQDACVGGCITKQPNDEWLCD